MADKISIKEQVDQLTTEQQDKIIKVGKISVAMQLIGGIPWFILTILGICTIISPPLGFDYANYDKLFLGFIALLVIGAVYIFGILIFVKVKYPYYSDAKWKYINNMRKTKK